MRSDNWFGRFWTRLRSGVVQDVPPNLEECETCREVDCTQERWLQCEKRLAAEAASLSANAPGRTDELLPCVAPAASPGAMPAPASGRTEEIAGPPQARKTSNNP